MVVRLRGGAATARHLAIARAEFTRERRRMKEHAWKASGRETPGNADTLSHRLSATSLPKTITPCAPVSLDTNRGFERHVSQSYHDFRLQLALGSGSSSRA